MMKEKTEKMIEQVEELMSKVMAVSFDARSIARMSKDELVMYKTMCELFETSKDLAVYQAEVIDEQNEKLNLLLEQNAELVRLIQLKV